MPVNVYKNAEKNMKLLKAGKLGRLAKLKRTAKELLLGEKTYLPKKKKVKKAKKSKPEFKTVRTSAVERRLSASGMTEAEIQRLRGK